MPYTRVAIVQMPDWDVRPRLRREMATKLREWKGKIDPRSQKTLRTGESIGVGVCECIW